MTWVRRGVVHCPRNRYGWDATHATIPVLDRREDRWRVYFGTRDKSNRSHTTYIDLAIGDPSRVLYEHDRPILDLGPLGSFDEAGIMPTWIVGEAPKYLYYVGWSVKATVPFENHTGLAISEDGGSTFRKVGGPVLGKGIEDPYFTGTCCVVPGEEWRGYYMSGLGWEPGVRPEPMYDIKYATSTDGISWVRRGLAIGLRAGEAGICQASVVRGDEGWGMWYSYRRMGDYRTSPVDGYRIGFADSPDGITWRRMDDHRGLLPAASGWDSGMVCSSHVFFHGDEWWMFYNGDSFGRDGFGWATWEGRCAGGLPV